MNYEKLSDEHIYRNRDTEPLGLLRRIQTSATFHTVTQEYVTITYDTLYLNIL